MCELSLGPILFFLAALSIDSGFHHILYCQSDRNIFFVASGGEGVYGSLEVANLQWTTLPNDCRLWLFVCEMLFEIEGLCANQVWLQFLFACGPFL